MRKSSVRTLRQENNARERALSRESQREMTDVVVYLSLCHPRSEELG